MNSKGNIYNLYKFSLFTLFISSLYPYFFWNLSPAVTTLFYFCSSILFAVSYKNALQLNKANIASAVFIVIFLLYVANYNNPLNILNQFILSIVYVILLLLRRDIKAEILVFITKSFATLLAISLCFFLARYILGINLPHTVVNHVYNYPFECYTFFIVGCRVDMFMPRFMSVFSEPGFLGLAGGYLLYTQSFSMKKWYNIIILISVILSFSLTGYVLLILGAVLHFMFGTNKHRLVIISGLSLFIFIAVGVIQNYNGGNNQLNTLILNRLIIEDGDLSGNNRFTDDFESNYKQFVKSNDIILGKSNYSDDQRGGSAGYKVFFYRYGIVGLVLMLLLYYSFTNGYSYRVYAGLCIVYLAAFIPQAQCMLSTWLISFICGLPLLDRTLSQGKS
ncbi:MAG: hypothetical protein SNG34_04095 [Rikenellaceae bacterium]